MKLLNKYVIALLFSTIAFVGCKEDEVEPEEEHEQEVITDVKLVFTNVDDADDVVTVLAQDPDGEGVEELEIIDEINLDTSKTYNLTLEISNNSEDESEDIGEEILEEADEHQIFFGFTNDAFTSPAGNGNIDNASDFIDYKDQDSNDNPVGLETSWETGSDVTKGGTFTVRLQHQPDEKTSTSGATDGDTDFDLTFVLNIQ